jgi:DNA-directed RNA polymerase specialized sigma24 family protein
VVMRAALNARMGPAGQEARLARSEGDARGGRPDRHAGDRSAEEDGRLLARLLGKALERLEDSDRLILLLYYEQGLTLEQIEPILHASKATLSRRLKRLREQLLADVAALARTETGASVDRLRPALERAASEFDLAAALAGRLQGNDRGRV